MQSIYWQDTISLPQKDIGITKMRLFYSGSNSQLIGYANACYITNKLSIYLWKYCNFLEICQTNISGYFIKSFRNYCNP